MNEWIGEIILFIFIVGREYQTNRSKNNKVDDHEKELKALDEKIKSTKEELKVDITTVRTNVHNLTNNFNAFKQTNEVKTSIVLMLLFQVCKSQGIDTDMAQFILNTDTPDGLKDHKK